MFAYIKGVGNSGVARESRLSYETPFEDTNAVPVFKQIRLEVTNNCSYRCFCCPREKMTRPRGVMSLADLQLLIDRIGYYEGVVHYHGFGEALLDKQLKSKIRLVKQAWPRSQSCIVTTLGIPLKKSDLRELFEAGLSDVRISMYGYSREEYERLHGVDAFDCVVKNLDLLSQIKCEYPSLKVRVILSSCEAHGGLDGFNGSFEEKRRFTDYLVSSGFNELKTMTLHNYGDGRNYRAAGSPKVCSIVWGRYKSYLQVSWNLNVIPCCMCYNDQIVWGSLKTQSLQEIFQGDVYRRFIRAHQVNQLEPYPLCSHCHKDFSNA
jgi:hypothetical protein